MKTCCNSVRFKSSGNARRATALLIVVTFLNLSPASLSGVFASPRPGAAVATGMTRVAGSVTIDGERATSGQTIFPGSLIVTSERSESIIDLEKFTRLVLSEKTEFTLDFSRAHISSLLSKGIVRAFIPAGIPVNIRTAGAELITDPNQPAAFTAQVDGETTEVSVKTGRVEVRIGDHLRSLGPGEVFATGSGSSGLPVAESNLTSGQKIGIFVAIGTAAAILAVAILGRDKEELDFGGCVVVSGESPAVCP